ncbi:MAG: hypothetical protein L3K18_04440 [Thermoplasmata archaeon]|nr:hypothetical protein [Thermoplasmata archaeon]
MTETFSEWLHQRYAQTLLLAVGLNALTQFLIWEPWFGVQFLIIVGLTGISAVSLGASMIYFVKDRRTGRILAQKLGSA